MNLAKIHEQFGGYCVYCGVQTKLEYGPGERHLAATRDHLIPISAGGKNGEKNEVLACYPCNRRKGSLDPRTLIYLWNERDPEGFDGFVSRIKDSVAAIGVARTAVEAVQSKKLSSKGVVTAFAAKAAFAAVGRYLA